MARLVPDIGVADPMAAGLLIECRGQTPEALEVGLSLLSLCAAGSPHVQPAWSKVQEEPLLSLLALWCSAQQGDQGDQAKLGACAWSRVSHTDLLQERILEVMSSMKTAGLPFGARKAEAREMEFYPFKRESKDYSVYWDVRKGLIPIVGGARETGTPQLALLLSDASVCCLLVLVQQPSPGTALGCNVCRSSCRAR